jgi:hypothetical protein
MKRNKTIILLTVFTLAVMLGGCKSVPIDYAAYEDVSLTGNTPEAEQVPVGLIAYINVNQFDDTPVNWYNAKEGTYMYVKVPAGSHTLRFKYTPPLYYGIRSSELNYTFPFESGKKYFLTMRQHPADVGKNIAQSRHVYILLEVDDNGKIINRNLLDRSVVE